MTLAEKGDLAGAEEALQKAADSTNAGRESFYDLAEVKFARGDTAGAMKWYEKASSADPSWGKPLYKLGLSALKQGDRSAAAAFMTRTIAVDPVSPEAVLARSAVDQLNK
jgi:Tfp pilus assembly protein PilF